MDKRDSGDVGSGDGVVQDIDSSQIASLAVAAMLWSALKQWGGRILSIVVFAVLARTLAPEDFGLVALAAVFIGFLEVPLRVSLGDALVQRKVLRDIELDSAFWGLFGASVLLAAGLAATAPWIGSGSDTPGVAPLIMALALSLPLTGISVVPQAILRRQMRFKTLTVRRLSADLVAGVVAIGLALAGAGVWALVAKSILQSIVLTGLAMATVDWRPRLRFQWSALREIATFGAWSVGNSVVGFANRHVDDLVIGFMLGAVALGYYVVAFQLLTIAVLLVTNTIESAALSAFSRVGADRDRVGRGVTIALRANMLVVTAISALTIALAPSITLIMFGSQWLPSAGLVRILIVGSLMAPIASLAVTVMKSSGRPDLTLKVAIPNTVILVVLMVSTVPLGLYWVSSARIFLLGLFVPINLYFLHRLCDVRWHSVAATFAKTAVVGLAAGAVAVATIGSWTDATDSLARFSVAVLAGGIVYVLGILAMARSELRELWAFFRRRNNRAGVPVAGAA
ncbi:MAG: lipopolysaccharide biosynthesis protein [Acidimicrobiales bacterium]